MDQVPTDEKEQKGNPAGNRESAEMQTRIAKERLPTGPSPSAGSTSSSPRDQTTRGTGQIVKETYYKTTLPCGRKCELRNETFTIVTRSGEELNFGFDDVKMLQRMADVWTADRK